MRIVCMIPAMGPGGAERAMSHIVAHLAQRHEVALLTLERRGAVPFFALPKSVQLVQLDKLGGKGAVRFFEVLSRFSAIRREVRARAPDVVLSFMDTMNVAALISCIGLGIPVIVSERNDPALHRIGPAKELMRDRLYPLAKLVVVQTPRIARYFSLSNLRIIPNPVPTAPIRAHPERPNSDGRLRIVSVGRLEPHKGFDRLIEAFGHLAERYPDWDLRIIGEGPQRPGLEALVQSFQLDRRVQLPGLLKDVSGELAAANLIAFPSRYEGFPNALAEGLATGLPAIGLKGVSGVEDLIVDRKTGILVDDVPGNLTEALSRLMADAGMRRELGEAARNHVLQWAPAYILPLWETVLSDVAKSKSVN
jgi:GalNAc-alpha-(1->4)-GalNAc-alpha-(1->3)-diNAcBac-PP-undecaprenol alpha-1,4-N-acetyl-D-galactosaminyltransferase